MKTIKFSNEIGFAFAKELKENINHYLATHKTIKHGDRRMLLKSCCMLGIMCIPIVVIYSGVVTSAWSLFLLYLISGLGMAGVGMSIMHDALHGSYSSNKRLNQVMGFSINLIGASKAIWKIQHNVLHHTYTNIDEADDDLSVPPMLLRFTPGHKWYRIHRFQHWYVWLLYGTMTLVWVTVRDFVRISRYRKMGFFSGKGEFGREISKAVLWKSVYFTYALVLPMIIVPLSWWVVLLAFVSMHFVTGFMLSVVFQTAHVMPSAEFPKPDDNGIIGNNWSLHQLATTCNYAPKSRLFSWYIGGLNYQIEHHLMPHVCHLHYRQLSVIVRETAKKYGIPYHTKRTFLAALRDHALWLRELGRPEVASL